MGRVRFIHGGTSVAIFICSLSPGYMLGQLMLLYVREGEREWVRWC